MSFSRQLKDKFFFIINYFSRQIASFKRIKKVNLQSDLDKKLVFSLVKKSNIPTWRQLRHISKVLSVAEKRIIKILSWLAAISLIVYGVNYYYSNTKVEPAVGGEYIEGIVGHPEKINPLLSQRNEVDMDLTRLVFSSLLKYDEHLILGPDLAESYTISEDKKVYIFNLRKNVKWQDGESFSANDVMLTIDYIKNQDYGSPLNSSLRGVEVAKVDDYTIQFTLTEPYAPFLDILTFGIIPEHLWGTVTASNFTSSSLNIEKPIGTGPYKIYKKVKDDQGNIRSITLTRNVDYYLKSPYIETLVFKFYTDNNSAVEALINKNVHGLSFISTEDKSRLAKVKEINYYPLTMPQYTALFFNQKENSLLTSKELRRALTMAVDRQFVIEQVLHGEGKIVNGPIIPGFWANDPTLGGIDYNIEEANKILDNLGWTKMTPAEYVALVKTQAEQAKKKAPTGSVAAIAPVPTDEEILKDVSSQVFIRKNKTNQILTVNLTTIDNPEHKNTAELVKVFWQSLGVVARLNVVASAQFQREVIGPKKYDTLIYTEVVGSDPDPYPFWHSTQIAGQGLNLALFANDQADKLIEDARKNSDLSGREKDYVAFQKILAEELPAIFLYYPVYNYVVGGDTKGIMVERINLPADRFVDICYRYLETARKFIK